MILVDSNILIDLVDNDPIWGRWSMAQLQRHAASERLFVNVIVFAEIAPRFRSADEVSAALEQLEIALVDLSGQAAFLAGMAHLEYRRRGGVKANVLPDFFLGAHAAVLGAPFSPAIHAGTRLTSRWCG